MPLMFLVVFAPPHFKNAHLIVPALLKDSGFDRRAIQHGLAQGYIIAVRDHQHLVDHQFASDVPRYLLYLKP